MYKKKSLLWAILLITVKSAAQVGIGTEKPDTAAVLDINSGNKGVLLPRVALKSETVDLDGIGGQPEGLLVYNAGGTLPEGFYFWDGSAWKNIEAYTAAAPKISTLECAHAFIEPQVFIAGVPYTGILKVPYTGGNESKYTGGVCIKSEGNTGLEACLIGGRLERETGYFVYEVKGSPQEDSPKGAAFPITFDNKTCRATVGNTLTATATQVASVGHFMPTADNGAKGYHRYLSSPDKKFSVRVFAPDNSSFAASNLQIRSNVDDNVTIMWEGDISKTGSSNITGVAGNSLTLPKAGMWYGNTKANESPLPVDPNEDASWGENKVTLSEQRSFVWTTADIKEKSIYHLTLMIGTSDTDNTTATPENANKTKAFLRIEQIRED
ncbi:MAG: hypothetical protein LBJ58_03625 [Tannerellaceae bacterium]|jgi:hypothetical protein|nr:hypothetical protein [Tannerellaceae bacterium]